MNLEEEVGEIHKLYRQTPESKYQRAAKIETLKEKIIKGETTGDPIKDFAIVTNNDLSEEGEMDYRLLQEMLKNREEEQVLVVNEKIESSYRSGCHGDSGYTKIESTLRLGILTSDIVFEIGDGQENLWVFGLPYDRTELKGPRIILPTGKYVEKREGGSSDEKWKLVDGNIKISPSEFHDFDPESERIIKSRGLIIIGRLGRGSATIHEGRRLLIKVGEDVVKCFKSNDSLYNDDFSYVKALDLLGIKDQAPNDFVIGYNQEIGEAKGYVVKRLIELLEEGDISKSRIKSIYNIAERGGRISESGAITTIKGKDDAKVVSMGARQRLNKTRRDIVRKLEKAVELGMHNEYLTIDGEIPGQSLDARIFIRTLCGQYEVPYSKN